MPERTLLRGATFSTRKEKPSASVNTIVERLLADESGQDIVEYALLSAVIGIAAILIWQQLVARVGQVYGQTVAPAGQAQTLSSCMPGPNGTGC